MWTCEHTGFSTLISLFEVRNISFYVKLGHHAFMMSTCRGVVIKIFFAEGLSGGDGVGSGHKFGHFLWTS